MPDVWGHAEERPRPAGDRIVAPDIEIELAAEDVKYLGFGMLMRLDRGSRRQLRLDEDEISVRHRRRGLEGHQPNLEQELFALARALDDGLPAHPYLPLLSFACTALTELRFRASSCPQGLCLLKSTSFSSCSAVAPRAVPDLTCWIRSAR